MNARIHLAVGRTQFSGGTLSNLSLSQSCSSGPPSPAGTTRRHDHAFRRGGVEGGGYLRGSAGELGFLLRLLLGLPGCLFELGELLCKLGERQGCEKH